MRERREAPELDVAPFTTSRGLELVGRRALYRGTYPHLLHGAFGASGQPVSHGRRIQAMRARLGDGPVLVGVSAAWALGCRLADPDEPIHIVPPGGSGVRRQSMLVPHRVALDPALVVGTGLGPATCVTRTAIDLARGFGTGELPYGRRVAWVDALLRATPLTADVARAAGASARNLWHLAAAREVLAAARDGVDSVKETELRLLLARSGFPEPRVQCPVALPTGRVIAQLDLGWEAFRAGAEYDGAVHRRTDQHTRDMERHNLITAAGWTVIQVGARGLRRPDTFIPHLRTLCTTEFRRVRSG